MPDKILKNLNAKQIEAVKIIDGPVLVISGPGSGKTRCLTHRAAYLISQNIPAENILAVTFTNKAAGEMRERVEKLLGAGHEDSVRYRVSALPLISTFHSIGLKILRNEIHQLGYRRNFTVFDEDDQLSLLKRVMGDIEIDTKNYNPKIILYKISELKTKLIFPESYEPSDYYSEIVAKIYKKYQAELKELNATDFDDLIVLPIRIFRQSQETLNKYQDIWRYILVDEYQDTSYDQYILIGLLANKHRNIFCIGDDAQSIYQFRRADIRNILNFQKDYPEAKIIMLEQNYRSTKNIISAAQELISKNRNQIPKELWTDNHQGEKIIIAEAMNERHEAGLVVSKIDSQMRNGLVAKDFAILYRTHAQSRTMEEVLIMAGYPYQIVGGLKFYERKEIKDIIAYLKLIANPADSLALERIYNIPPRGIGKAMIEEIRKKEQPDIISALKELSKDKTLSTKKSGAVKAFYKQLSNITEYSETKKLKEIIKYIIKEINYEPYLKEFSLAKQGDYENFEDRLENLKELQTVASKYEDLPGKEGIERFLEEVTLLQQTDKMKDAKYSSDNTSAHQGKITLMTTHASKGLEFPSVFIIGLEEGLFPHSRSLLNPLELEEERRLCYVAITRAKQNLMITYAKYRNIYGSSSMSLPSRFITEIPGHLVDWQMINDFDDEEKIYY